ncbi:MAG TPA: hypothetical protein VFQ60_03610 [Patescibacteria group bacterium]|nr:hypothetical protein [Patescibacteria group bacterium]
MGETEFRYVRSFATNLIAQAVESGKAINLELFDGRRVTGVITRCPVDSCESYMVQGEMIPRETIVAVIE